MTNREKFEEIFNYHPDLSFCPIYCTYENTECTNFTKDHEQNNTCEAGEWWELEYQEPKQSNKSFPWCTNCKEYDQEKHYCPRYCKVIRRTVEEMKQEPRKGHWLSQREHCEMNNLRPSGIGSYFWCSECNHAVDVREWNRNHYNYCPNCGADMREVEK